MQTPEHTLRLSSRASALSAFTRVCDALWRETRDPSFTCAGREMGPGSRGLRPLGRDDSGV